MEDVYQQTCMALWKKREEIGDVRDFFSFACGFDRNEALHQLRRNSRKGAVQLSERLVAADCRRRRCAAASRSGASHSRPAS